MSAILLIEDDETLGATLEERLGKVGYQVHRCSTFTAARGAILSSAFDLAIIDVGLPDGNGFELAKLIREHSNAAIVFLTAMTSAEYRLKGYELGADEYIPKPFHLKELLLLVARTLSRRPPSRVIKVGDITIDLDAMIIRFSDGSTEQPITRDFRLLEAILSASPRVVPREELLKLLFQGEEDLPTPRTIDNSIVRLRAVLKRGNADYLRSVRGVGYQWLPERA